MRRVWELFKSYIFWTHSRGSVHYDVMVTLILLFIFVTPRAWFRDRPAEQRPHQSEVVVQPDGEGFVYSVDASAVNGQTDDAIRADLLKVIEPISGEVAIRNYEGLRDKKGRVYMYRVWVQR